jgi:hypothetical protein
MNQDSLILALRFQNKNCITKRNKGYTVSHQTKIVHMVGAGIEVDTPELL